MNFMVRSYNGNTEGNQMVSAFDSRKHMPSGGKRLLLKDAKWHLSNFLVDQFVSVLLGKTSASALSRWGYGCWEIEHEKKENRIFSAGPASSVRTMVPNIVSICNQKNELRTELKTGLRAGLRTGLATESGTETGQELRN